MGHDIEQIRGEMSVWNICSGYKKYTRYIKLVNPRVPTTKGPEAFKAWIKVTQMKNLCVYI